ncbi:MAG: sporulation protein YqfD, partial [Oscillospiraceae bacterium]|nr:sporulation protein YqfD [Oscillospiraceae bacterium]
MMKRAVALLRGSLRVRVTCKYPERVLNICAARGIALRAPEWLSETELSFEIARRDERALRRALDNLGAAVRVER